jgi:D-xylose reductase
LKKLKVDYVDLYLVHWTWPEIDHEKKVIVGPPMHIVWGHMEEMVEKGLTKGIGLSNTNMQILLDILAYAKIRPAVN